MDEFDAHATSHDDIGDTSQVTGSSRRSFLKAAVIGSAAAVAVSGAGAATLTLTGHHTGLTRFVVLASVSGITAHACTTNTDSSPQDKSTFGSESLYFWALFKNVPAGTYSLDVSPPITTTSLLGYQDPGNSVFMYEYAGGSTTYDCHPSTLPTSGNVLPAQSVLPIEGFTLSADTDLLLEVHLQANKVQNTYQTGTVTLTANLYSGSTATGTSIDHASATVTIS